jgi:uncharacterized protein with PIN domain
MRFHLDEHVADAIADGLRRRGIDVTTSAQVRLLQATDEQHIAFAAREGRVIVTRDRDFLHVDELPANHAGIVYYPQGSRSIGEVVRYLILMNDCLRDEDMVGRIEFA